MAKESATDYRKRITKDIMTRLDEMLQDEGFEVFYTGENFNTLTFCADEDEKGNETFGSIKFTLHKSNYNLDDEIEKYELFREERELKDKLQAEKKAEKLRKAQERQAKIDARESAKQKEIEKTRNSIEKMKADITEKE